MIELLSSVTLLVFGVLSLAAGFYGSATLAEQARQNDAMKQTYRSMVAELKAVDLSSLPVAFGTGSGKANFWYGDDSSAPVTKPRLYFTRPKTVLLSGNVKFYTDERALPPSWTSFSGGLDLNADGLLSALLGLLGGLLGLLGGGGGGGAVPTSDPLVLPTVITATAPGSDGPRTLEAGLILSR